MSARRLTPPAVEPWTVAEAKSFLRVEHDADDAVIAALIAAARNHIESLTRRAMIAQVWRFTRDAWPDNGRIALRMGPARSITAARVFGSTDVASSLDTDRFVVDAGADVIAAPVWSLPQPGRSVAGIELDIELGYGAAASDVPEVLRHAVRTLAAHWYENRGLAAIGGSVALLPGSVTAMIASYRTLSL